ncbi:Uncharacterised protein [Vibrio cholerae]|nr:Uncharacterised protein [Vibrio cholerae]
MHPSGLVQLAHCRIDDRIPSLAFTPELELFVIIPPLQTRAPLHKVTTFRKIRLNCNQMLVKLTPDEFAQPGLCPFTEFAH